MKLLAKIIVAFVLNAAGIWIAAQTIPGFEMANDVQSVLGAAGLLTLLNFIVRPFFKLILAPLIILTLGFGLLVVNAAVLKLLDILTLELTIQSIQALALSTLLMSAVNIVFHLATRK